MFEASELNLESNIKSMLCFGIDRTHEKILDTAASNMMVTVEYTSDPTPTKNKAPSKLPRWKTYTNSEGKYQFECKQNAKSCKIKFNPSMRAATKIRLHMW